MIDPLWIQASGSTPRGKFGATVGTAIPTCPGSTTSCPVSATSSALIAPPATLRQTMAKTASAAGG